MTLVLEKEILTIKEKINLHKLDFKIKKNNLSKILIGVNNGKTSYITN